MELYKGTKVLWGITTKELLAVFAIFAIFPLCGAAQKYSANIPVSTNKVVIDGKISPDEWSDAAVIRRIYNKKNIIPSDPKTEFFVKYGDENLYIAVLCHESDPGYPEAYQRKWNDLLFRNDDAVQVVLGLKDKNVAVNEKIDMGGYEGALDGKGAKADFYYCYTVNAVGSKQRTFNETLLENALFDAAVGKGDERNWVVEFKIPFKSFGLKNPADKSIFANLFRFRPPLRTGWNYKNFWGYSSMPFGKFHMLPKGKEGLKTVQEFPLKPVQPLRLCGASIQYSPLSGAVIGKAEKTGDWGTLYGVLNVSGLPEQKEKLDFGLEINRDAVKELLKPEMAAVIAKITPGDQPEREVTFKIVDEEGKVISSATQSFKKVTAPEWMGTKNGEEYVNEKFPAPWTEPQVAGKKVKLLDKEIVFNEFCLPESVKFTAKGEELLAGKPYIEVNIAGEKAEFKGDAPELQKDGNACRVSSELKSGNAVLKIKTKLEADGFTLVKFKVDNIPPESIEKVSLCIPVKSENAKFLMHGIHVQKTGNISSAGFRNNADSLWVGTYDKGLSFNFDTPLFFSKNIRHQMEVLPQKDKDVTWLKFNFCDGPGQISKDTVFRFFLQPTPTKPQQFKSVKAAVRWKWERWGEWHGYPDLSKIPELKKWTSKVETEDKRIGLLYTCQGLQIDAPYFKEFRSDLEMHPKWRYYRNKGKDCFATSKRGPEGDLQLWGWKQLIEKAGVRGLVSDGLINAWGDSNPAHWEIENLRRPVKWDSDISSRVVAQRNFMKRLRGLFTDAEKSFCIVSHTGGGIDINTMSFTDAYLEGEQMARFKNGYYPALPVFAVGYSGQPWGWQTFFWAKRWRNYKSIDSSLAYVMLFNSELSNHNDLNPKDLDLKFYNEFRYDENFKFIPFWEKNNYALLSSRESLSSMYLAKGKAMIVVSNLSTNTDNYKLDISKLFPGEKLDIKEQLSDKGMKKGRLIEGTLKPHSCDIIRVEVIEADAAVASKSKAPFSIKDMNAKAWKVNTKAPGVKSEYPVTVGNVKDLLRINSKPKKALAEAVLKSFAPEEDATVKLIIVPQRRFNISLGKFILSHDHGWFMREKEGKVFTNIPDRFMKFDYDKPHQMLLVVRDGKLFAWLDSKVVVNGYSAQQKNPVKPLTLAVWHDDVLAFKTELLSNIPQEGPDAPEFDIDSYRKSDWKVSPSLEYIKADYEFKLPDERIGLLFNSVPMKHAAEATLTQEFGRDLSIDLLIKLSKRFRFKIGPNFLVSYGGGWTGHGWLARGELQNRGSGRIIRDVPIVNRFVPMRISINDGVLDLVYNNMVVIEKMPLNLPKSGNSFSMVTWANDKIIFTVNEISSKPEKIIENETKHPILK